ncbi:tetratricopeptide repeat protein [Flavobacterium sp. ANB]|uniref:toxin-antitoxin system YwqK family antitoxin n=1 Tax=unclassified Flavobacterium TaxID=196869 RepID=UPI0012B8234B|nr:MULTISPECIES: toxin-antitoxin system YwqK family antitoxin [unclassified Flavobacterium]MBF4516430.1 tetratricopeptide repeat protein [Flavobacterium sp. ANB]MTD69673.1 tetratricopeptide repeat protein [Flavobacterium sp. LC2016-13]
MRKILLVFFLVSFSKNYAQIDYAYVYNNDSIIKKGVDFYDNKKYDEALKEFHKISKIDPKYLNAQYEIALTLSAQEKKTELKTFLEDLYKGGKMDENPELYKLYGIFLSNEKEYDLSEKIFKEGEKYLSNSSTFQYNFAILYVRKKEPQKAVDILKRIVTNDPNHASSHYLLGSIALENGKIVEGTLALMSYLIVAPTGAFASQAVMQLNANYGQNYLTENKLVFSKSGDNFEEIETVLRNQLPLKKVYKIKSSIDDVLTRQVQAVAEYSAEHKIADGFFETTYMPWVKQMVEKNQLEGYSYYSLLSIEDKIGKELNKQKKKIVAFVDDYATKDLWSAFGKRKLDLFGKEEEVIVSIRNERPYIIGKQTNGEFQGKCKYLNAYGNLNGELNFIDGNLDGLQKYYDEKGKLTEEKYFTAGKLNGKRTSYYENGNIALTENYKDDKLDGICVSYFPNGGKNCEINFTNGERDGNLVCLYETGTKKNEIDYKNGKLSGKYNIYNEIGALTETYNCVDNKIEGNYVEYFDGKTIKSEAVYKNGIVEGSYKFYNVNKALEKENIYALGDIVKSTDYFENGKKSYESIYNKGDLETYSFFDIYGNKYFEEKHKSGELKSGLQFSPNDSKGVPVNLTKKSFELKNFDGTLRIKGAFEKGKKSGEWNYLYASGVLRLNEFYIAGKTNGISTSYDRNGDLSSKNNYTNDTISGRYEVYDGDKVSQLFNYEKGEQNGPYQTFYSDGAVSTEGFMVENDIAFDKFTYFQNGKISNIDHYINSYLTNRKTFDINGKQENDIDYKNKTGKFTLSFQNGAYSRNYEMKNGILNGKFNSYDKFKTNIVEAEYINGKLHNLYKEYSPLGSLLIEKNYYCGKLNGLSKYYDYVGNLRLTEEHNFGVENGKTIRYYHNKSKMIEYAQINSAIEGETTYFNQKGEPIVIIGYENNIPKYFIRKNKTGELNDKINIENQTADILSSYPNGKIAIQFKLNKGSITSKFIINSFEGKLEYECTYRNSGLEGERIEYYTNGKPFKKENFVNNSFEGKQQYFKEDGQLWAEISLKSDELHGNVLIYNAGKLVETKKYDSDELVDIIK